MHFFTSACPFSFHFSKPTISVGKHHHARSHCPRFHRHSCNKFQKRNSSLHQSYPVVLHSWNMGQVHHSCCCGTRRLLSAQLFGAMRIPHTPLQEPNNKGANCGTAAGSASATGAACASDSSAMLAKRLLMSCIVSYALTVDGYFSGLYNRCRQGMVS